MDNLTPQELETAGQMLREGKSPFEVKSQIAQMRAGLITPPQGAMGTQTQDDGVIGDIGATIRGIGDVATQRMGTVAESASQTQWLPSFLKKPLTAIGVPERAFEGRQTVKEFGAQTVAQGVFGLGDAAFELVLGAGRLGMTQEEEEAFAGKAGEVIQSVAQTPTVQFVTEWYTGLDDRTQRNMAIPVAAIELLTAGWLGRSRRATSLMARSAEEAVDVTQEAAEKGNRVLQTLQRGEDAITGNIDRMRFALSDIDPASATSIRRLDEPTIKELADAARKGATDPKEPSAMAVVGTRGEEAYEIVQGKISKAERLKQTALAEVGDTRLTGNFGGNTIDEFQRVMQERFGVRFDQNAVPVEVPGRVSGLTTKADANLASEFLIDMRKLGMNPTVKQVDDMIDRWQRKLYKQSRSRADLDAAEKQIVKALQGVLGSLNKRLRNADEIAGTGYVAANATMSELIPVAQVLSRGLGAGGAKGAGFMKQALGPAAENARPTLLKVEEITGIPLIDQAQVAKFMMEASGDARQRSLLQQVGVTLDDVSGVDFTRPATILRFLKENVDMDGEELALYILREARRAEDAGTIPQGTSQAVREAMGETLTPQPQGGVAPATRSGVRQGVSSSNNTTKKPTDAEIVASLTKERGAVGEPTTEWILQRASNEMGKNTNKIATLDKQLAKKPGSQKLADDRTILIERNEYLQDFIRRTQKNLG